MAQRGWRRWRQSGIAAKERKEHKGEVRKAHEFRIRNEELFKQPFLWSLDPLHGAGYNGERVFQPAKERNLRTGMSALLFLVEAADYHGEF